VFGSGHLNIDRYRLFHELIVFVCSTSLNHSSFTEFHFLNSDLLEVEVLWEAGVVSCPIFVGTAIGFLSTNDESAISAKVLVKF